MRTASELLALAPARPLTMRLTARPARACIFVPDIAGVPWQRVLEYAIAAQVRVWGGSKNLVIPAGWPIPDDELFWRIIDRLDPDVFGVFQPTYADMAEIAPVVHAEAVQRYSDALEGLGDIGREQQLARIAGEQFFHWTLSDEFEAMLVERTAPLHWEQQIRYAFVEGTTRPSDPFTDALALNELPESVIDITTTLGDIERLQLTHAVGRILPAVSDALAERVIAQPPVTIDRPEILYEHLWQRARVARDFTYPWALGSGGLHQRIWGIERGQVVVVVGDERRDFMLASGLAKMRPGVVWLPTPWIEDGSAFDQTTRAASEMTRIGLVGGNRIAITTTGDPAVATEAVALITQKLRDLGNDATEVEAVDWRNLMPSAAAYFADAASERQVALVLHEGQTASLPTPIPVGITAKDPLDINWMVDVEVEGWTPIRDSRSGAQTFSGPWASEHDVRTSALGPSYSGASGFRPTLVSLEATTAKPALVARSITEQVRSIMATEGWEIEISDKGAYALETVRLFRSLEATVNALRDPIRRAILDAYLVPDGNGLGIFVRDTQRRYLTLEAAAVTVGTEEAAADVLARLYDERVLRRGHVLKCARCRASSFYTLTTEQEFTCVRCHTPQRVSRAGWLGTAEPTFYYELSEVVYQFFRNNGHLPLLAAHDHFVIGRERERRPFDVTFELEFVPPQGKKREHDIVASWGSELWLGEATSADGFGTRAEEETRIRRLRTTAGVIRARGILLITESAQFSARTRAMVDQYLVEPGWPEVVYIEAFSAAAVSATDI
jgi:hypothetical protein